MGHRAHPRRATQAGHRRQQSLDPTLSLARANALTKPDLTHVPAQPRPPSLAADLLTVPTLTFETLYNLVLIAHDRRELAHANVTANPTAAWVWRQLIEDTPWATSRGICSQIAMLSMATISVSAPTHRHRRNCHAVSVTRANAVVERVIGTLRVPGPHYRARRAALGVGSS